MQLPALTEADQHFRQLLLEHALLSEKQLEKVLLARQQAWDTTCRDLEGRFCSIQNGHFYLDLLPSGTRVLELPLESEAVGRQKISAITLNPQDGRLLQTAELTAAEVGLLLTDETVYLMTRNFLEMPVLLKSLSYQGHPHHDLYLSPRRDMLFVSERFQGRLHAMSLVTNKLLKTLNVRPPGSYKAINMAISQRGDRAWITDQESPHLGCLNLSNWELNLVNTRFGTLGNLCLAPDQQGLYLTAIAPIFQLLYLELDSLDVIRELEVKGYPRSLQPDMPSDPLQIAYNGKSLFFLAAQDEGGEEVPLLHVIDTGTLQTLGTQRVPCPWLPRLAADGETNPLLICRNKRLEDWVVELGLLSAENLVRLRQGVSLGPDGEPAYEVPQGDESPWELVKRPAPPIQLPETAHEVLVEFMIRAFFQETRINLREEERTLPRLYREAETVRQELEQRYVAIVELDKILGKHLLQALITRESLLQELDVRLGGRELPFRPTHRCPMCQAALRAPRLCHGCGFQLDDPDWALRREKQSAEACSELIPGQLLLALPHVGQLVLLNAWHQVVEEWKAADCELSEPFQALALPSQGYLVVDRKGQQVLELNPAGEPVQKLQHPFEEPVAATFYALENGEQRTLVVDKAAHLVLEFDLAGKYTAKWGLQQDLSLKEPQDVQRTWNETFLIADTGQQRVIEIDTAGQIVQSWGKPQNLNKPVLARRLLSGDTLIIDAGRGEILTYDAEQRLMNAFQYWPPPEQPAFLARQPAPDRFLVLSQGDIIALGRRYWMQIQVTRRQIRWIQPWTGERRPPSLKSFIQQVSEETPVMQALRKVTFLRQTEGHLLSILAEHLSPLQAAPGERLIQQGSMGNALYFLTQGEVEVRKGEQPEPVAVLQAGDLFGEISLILSEPRTADVVARTSCELLQLERGDLKKVLARFPALAQHLRQLAQERKSLMHFFQHRMQEVVVNKVKARLAVSRLEELGFFENPPEGVLEQLAGAMRSVAFMPGQELFAQGESGDTLYFIARGSVAVYLDQAPEPVARLAKGEVFGEMSVLLDAPRSASVRTDSYCQLYELDRYTLEQIVETYPALQQRLLRIAQQRQALNAAERERRAAAPPEPERRTQAEITAAGPVRPLFCHLLRPFHEQLLTLNQDGDILATFERKTGLHLYKPYRVNVTDNTCWIADSGHDRILAFENQRIRLELGARLGLQQPRSALPTANGQILIADEGNQRVILVTPEAELLWEYTSPHEILSPVYAEQTPTGNVLFCDQALQMVFEVNPRNREVVWSYGQMMIAGEAPEELNGPACVRRMSNGATLIADTGNDRLLLISPAGTLMRILTGSDEMPLHQPYHCEILPTGDILVYSQACAEVIRFGLSGQPVWRASLPS